MARGLAPTQAARWHRAALLHDALRDAGAAELSRYTPQGDWPAALWHGPAAAAAAERHGESDRGVLDAVRYHSVGFADWDDVGRALYLADYLEPGREFDRTGRAALAARVPGEFALVLTEVAAQRVAGLLDAHQPVRKETFDFWNRLAGDATSSS